MCPVSGLAGHTSWDWRSRFSPDGRRTVSCSRDRTMRIWDGSPLEADVSH